MSAKFGRYGKMIPKSTRTIFLRGDQEFLKDEAKLTWDQIGEHTFDFKWIQVSRGFSTKLMLIAKLKVTQIGLIKKERYKTKKKLTSTYQRILKVSLKTIQKRFFY